MTHDRSKSRLDELQGLLETYGADTRRWPQAARARAEVVLGADRQAARMLAEAKALDAVLARAPLPAPERHAALADRIVAEARSRAPEITGAGAGRSSGIVIPWPRAARRAAREPVAAIAHRAQWRAAGLLAASLALGVFIGALDLAPASVDQLMTAVEYDGDLDQLAAAMASDGLAAVLDEDLL
jgi:hypothetical protein